MLYSEGFNQPGAAQLLPGAPRSLLHLLVSSYAIAAMAAVLAAFAGAGFWASLLVFWLGGAAMVFALALISGERKPDQARTDQTGTGLAAPWIALEGGR